MATSIDAAVSLGQLATSEACDMASSSSSPSTSPSPSTSTPLEAGMIKISKKQLAMDLALAKNSANLDKFKGRLNINRRLMDIFGKLNKKIVDELSMLPSTAIDKRAKHECTIVLVVLRDLFKYLDARVNASSSDVVTPSEGKHKDGVVAALQTAKLHPDVEYSLKRFVRGLLAPEVKVKMMFSYGLLTLIERYSISTCQLKCLVDELLLAPGVVEHEADRQLGKLAIFTIVLKPSVNDGEAPFGLSQRLEWLKDLLLDLQSCKPYLREAYGRVAYEFLASLSSAELALVRTGLKFERSHSCVETFSLSRFLSQSKKLDDETLKNLENSYYTYPRLHFLFDVLASDDGASKGSHKDGDRASLQVWDLMVAKRWLKSSSHEKKHLGLLYFDRFVVDRHAAAVVVHMLKKNQDLLRLMQGILERSGNFLYEKVLETLEHFKLSVMRQLDDGPDENKNGLLLLSILEAGIFDVLPSRMKESWILQVAGHVDGLNGAMKDFVNDCWAVSEERRMAVDKTNALQMNDFAQESGSEVDEEEDDDDEDGGIDGRLAATKDTVEAYSSDNDQGLAFIDSDDEEEDDSEDESSDDNDDDDDDDDDNDNDEDEDEDEDYGDLDVDLADDAELDALQDQESINKYYDDNADSIDAKLSKLFRLSKADMEKKKSKTLHQRKRAERARRIMLHRPPYKFACPLKLKFLEVWRATKSVEAAKKALRKEHKLD